MEAGRQEHQSPSSMIRFSSLTSTPPGGCRWKHDPVDNAISACRPIGAVEYAIDESQKTATLVWRTVSTRCLRLRVGYAQRSPTEHAHQLGLDHADHDRGRADGSIVSELTSIPARASYRVFASSGRPSGSRLWRSSRVLCLGSRGARSRCHRAGGSGLLPADVELSTVRLNGTVPADTTSANWGGPMGPASHAEATV